MPATQGEEAGLQLGSGAIRRECLSDRQAAEFGFPKRRGKLGWGNEVTEVFERAARFGHRNAVSSGAIRGIEAGGSVESDPGAFPFPGPARDSDMN